MIFSHHLWWSVILIQPCLAIGMLDVLHNYPELSMVSSMIASSSISTAFLSNAQNFTFLAPSNNAIMAFNTPARNFTFPGLVEAMVQYCTLQGYYTVLSFSQTPQFAVSNLHNQSFANVTGGQVIELVADAQGNPTIITGNTTIISASSTDLVAVGGLIHIIDQVPVIPTYAVMELTSARLPYFMSLLGAGDFLSLANVDLTMGVMAVSDVTFFVPNSAGALEKFKKLARTMSQTQLQAVWQYHYVPDYVGYSSNLQDGTTLTTAQGSQIVITRQDGNIYVNSAKVIETDILCSNGVIHVLDNLLDWNDTSPPPRPRVSTFSMSKLSSTIAPTAITSPTVAATMVPAVVEKSESNTNTNLKIGIGIGCSAAGVLAIAAVFFFLRYRSAKNGGFWDGRPVDDTSKYYLNRGQVKKHEDLGLGLQSTALRDIKTANSADDASSRQIVSR